MDARMGKRGPRQKPLKLHKAQGTYRPDRHGPDGCDAEFEPLAALPSPPGVLDEVGLYEWERVGNDLVAQRILTNVDLGIFTAYCVATSIFIACQKIVKAKGMTYVLPSGYEQARPEVTIGRQARVEMKQYSQELGITPAARTRVKPVETKGRAKPADPWSVVKNA